MAACQSSAQSAGAVRTLLQRVRPIPGLSSRQFQERQAAQRKVVNSIIQVHHTNCDKALITGAAALFVTSSLITWVLVGLCLQCPVTLKLCDEMLLLICSAGQCC